MSLGFKLPTASTPCQPDTRDEVSKDAQALFREARRRARRRRLVWLAVSIAVAGAGFGGYLLAGTSVPLRSESLLDRPLHFPALAPGETCPATPGKPISNSAFDGTALGNGPVRVLIANEGDLRRGQAILGTTGIPGHYALQTLWFAMPGYDGPFVVRARRLGANSPIDVQPTGHGPLVVPAGSTSNAEDGYRTIPGSSAVTSSGCYAWQVDGRTFSDIIIVNALPHP